MGMEAILMDEVACWLTLFFPSDGRLHFDDDETWTFNNATGIEAGHVDLLSVAIHELGHSLGLDHLQERDAIMYPFYRHPELDSRKQIKPFILSQFDIQAIQGIYGPREGGTAPAPPTAAPTAAPTARPTAAPIPPGPPTGGACPQFQATVTGIDGATYFFSNSNIGYKKRNVINDPASSTTKFYVDKIFPGVPSSGITAAFSDPRDQLTFLFQGRRVYGYEWTPNTASYILKEGYPKDLQNDVPFTPEGAFLWGGNHIILYGGKGNQLVYWDSSSNQAFSQTTIQSYFNDWPTYVKAPFAVGDKLYFLDVSGSSVVIYNLESRKGVGNQPLKTLITC